MMRSALLLAVLFTASTVPAQENASANAPADTVLRVCADPHNLPLSNDGGEGYENRIAQQLAQDLGRKVEYTFFPQRMGFVRNTLRSQDAVTRQYKCDVIIGVPSGYELTATTKPYMRSTYALVYRGSSELGDLRSADDILKLPAAKLQTLHIGVFGKSPGVDWLLRNRLLDRASVYAPQSGDPEENPMLIVERELEAGHIDAAIVWGPIAGYLVGRHAAFPAWRAVPFKSDGHIRFDYEIAMGVRFGEKEWKATLDEWIAGHRPQIEAILVDYRIPLLDADGNVTRGFATGEAQRAGSVPKTIPLQLTPPDQ